MIEGKADLLDACRRRRMKVAERAVNLLESRVSAEGNLDGMEVRLSANCISGLPGESEGSISFRGNLTQLLSVLGRVWPAPPDAQGAPAPGRKTAPGRRPGPKAPAE